MDKELILALKDIIIQAGEIAIRARAEGLIIEYKKDNSPVTNADKEISNFIYSKLRSLMHAIPIICEEQPLVDIDKNKIFWLVDPIDGTRSFIKNKDSFTVNIALIEKQAPIIGFIYQPSFKKLYYTDENQNFCIEENGKLIEQIIHNKEGFIAVVSSRNFSRQTENYIKENNFSEVIAIPSSIKLCMVAEGLSDVYPKFGDTMEWDIAAGHALINAAGGKVLDEHGNHLLYAKDGFRNEIFFAMSKKWLNR